MNFYDRINSAAILMGVGLLLVIEIVPIAVETYEILEREDSQVYFGDLPEDDDPSLDDVVPYTTHHEALLDSTDLYEDRYGWPEVLNAIRFVETGGEPDQGRGAKGDNGNAYGPYQIWKVYYADATERQYEGLDTRDISWEDCLNDTYASEVVVMAYMRRYAYDEFNRLVSETATIDDVEKIARIHNGGPRGHKKSATLSYWTRVQEGL